MTLHRIAPLLAGAALACATHAKEPFQTVSVDEVERMLGAKDVVVVDANVPELWAKHHLPGARHLAGSKDVASVLPSEKDARVVFYCSGPR